MNWLDFLACPECFGDLDLSPDKFHCYRCNHAYYWEGEMPNFLCFPSGKREYEFEIERYNRIAQELPKDYCGHDESKPETRAQVISELIADKDTYLNIGPGFGSLEKLLPRQNKVCLDQSIGFLRVLQRKNLPNMWLVNAFAERMPFKTDFFPCIVSDSVWTVAVDQKEFFIENVRVLQPSGTFIAAINYRWNYPRKPQLFPVDNPSLLLRFLEELGVKAEAEYYDLETGQPCQYEQGQYQVVMGVN